MNKNKLMIFIYSKNKFFKFKLLTLDPADWLINNRIGIGSGYFFEFHYFSYIFRRRQRSQNILLSTSYYKFTERVPFFLHYANQMFAIFSNTYTIIKQNLNEENREPIESNSLNFLFKNCSVQQNWWTMNKLINDKIAYVLPWQLW